MWSHHFHSVFHLLNQDQYKAVWPQHELCLHVSLCRTVGISVLCYQPECNAHLLEQWTAGTVSHSPNRWLVLCQQHHRTSVFVPMHTSLELLCVQMCELLSLTILLFTSSSMALTSSAALGVSELLGRAERRDADWIRERKHRGEKKKLKEGTNCKTWRCCMNTGMIHLHWLPLCMWSGSPLSSLDCDIPHVHIRTGLCVISLIKGLIGGHGGANHRLVLGSRLSGGFGPGVSSGTGLLFKQEHCDWSNNLHKANIVA